MPPPLPNPDLPSIHVAPTPRQLPIDLLAEALGVRALGGPRPQARFAFDSSPARGRQSDGTPLSPFFKPPTLLQFPLAGAQTVPPPPGPPPGFFPPPGTFPPPGNGPGPDPFSGPGANNALRPGGGGGLSGNFNLLRLLAAPTKSPPIGLFPGEQIPGTIQGPGGGGSTGLFPGEQIPGTVQGPLKGNTSPGSSIGLFPGELVPGSIQGPAAPPPVSALGASSPISQQIAAILALQGLHQ